MSSHTRAAQAPEQTDMKTCRVWVAVQRSFRLVKSRVPRDMTHQT